MILMFLRFVMMIVIFDRWTTAVMMTTEHLQFHLVIGRYARTNHFKVAHLIDRTARIGWTKQVLALIQMRFGALWMDG